MSIWQEHGAVSGFHVKASFFEPAQRHETRPLGFMEPNRAVLIASEFAAQRRFESVVAEPDGLFVLGTGLISMEFKAKALHSATHWTQQLRLADMLQCMIGAVVVAHAERKTTACLLRHSNAAFLLVPHGTIPATVMMMTRSACRYFGLEDVGSRDLADYCAPLIDRMFPRPETRRSLGGRQAHRRLFKTRGRIE